MKKMKKVFTIMLCIFVIFSLAACGGDKPDTNTPADTNATTDDGNNALSKDILSREIELDNVVYTLPLKSVKPFLDAGWKSEKPLDFTIPSMTTTSGYRLEHSDGHRIRISFLNGTKKTKKVTDAEITYLNVAKRDVDKSGLSVKFPANINFNSSIDDVKAAYGVPSKETAMKESVFMTYGEKARNNVQFNFYKGELRDVTYNFRDPL